MTAGVHAQCIVLQAAAANSAPIFIGDANVSAADGYELVAGASVTLQAGLSPINVAAIWAYAASNQRLNVLVQEA